MKRSWSFVGQRRELSQLRAGQPRTSASDRLNVGSSAAQRNSGHPRRCHLATGSSTAHSLAALPAVHHRRRCSFDVAVAAVVTTVIVVDASIIALALADDGSRKRHHPGQAAGG